jgi:hypothetical protein
MVTFEENCREELTPEAVIISSVKSLLHELRSKSRPNRFKLIFQYKGQLMQAKH